VNKKKDYQLPIVKILKLYILFTLVEAYLLDDLSIKIPTLFYRTKIEKRLHLKQ